MRSASSPIGAAAGPTSSVPRGAAGGPTSSVPRRAAAGPTFSALTATRRPTSDTPARRSSAASGPAPRRGRVDEHQRSALADLAAAIAAGAAVCAALALVALPSVPTGVGLGAGAAVSLCLGWATVTLWGRWAVRDGAPVLAARRHAHAALLLAHVLAAVPVGIAVLLAG